MDHRWFKLTLLVMVAVLGGAAAAELLGQGYFRARNGRWLWQDEAFKTNTYIPYTMSISDRREYTLRPGFHDAITTVDDRGFRLTTPPSRPGDRIIINIGDSVVFGSGVADADTYSSRLAELFRAHNLSFGVVNAGISSYTTQQSFDRLRVDVSRYYAASQIAAVTFNAANDISLVFYYTTSYAPGLTWARARNLAPLRPEWQRFASAYYLSKADEAYAQRRVPLPTSTESPEDRMLNHVRVTLREELAFWRDRQVPVILLPINPFYYQLAHEERNSDLRVLREVYKGRLVEMTQWDALIRRFNGVLREVATDFSNAQYVETRAILDGEDRNPLYKDYLHFDVPGNQRMAQIIFDSLDTRRLLGRSRRLQNAPAQ